MIRTKYLLFAILACVVAILCAGFFTLSKEKGVADTAVPHEGIFSTPNDSFEIVPNTDSRASEERKEFISKIRNEVTKNPIQETVTIEPAESESMKEAEVSPAVPVSDTVEVFSTSTFDEGGAQ